MSVYDNPILILLFYKFKINLSVSQNKPKTSHFTFYKTKILHDCSALLTLTRFNPCRRGRLLRTRELWSRGGTNSRKWRLHVVPCSIAPSSSHTTYNHQSCQQRNDAKFHRIFAKTKPNVGDVKSMYLPCSDAHFKQCLNPFLPRIDIENR